MKKQEPKILKPYRRNVFWAGLAMFVGGIVIDLATTAQFYHGFARGFGVVGVVAVAVSYWLNFTQKSAK